MVEVGESEADSSYGSVSFFPVSAGEKAVFDGEIDAGLAYQLAARYAGQLGWPVGTVMSAMAETASGWPDGGPTRRPVFVVRWEGVSWTPEDQARLGQPVQRTAVVGTQTVVIDAATGAFLGTGLQVDVDGERWLDRSKECDLATVWAGRADMDSRFIVKAGSLSRGVWRQVLEACIVLQAAELPVRLSEMGARFAETLRLLDQHHGPVIGSRELADVTAILGHIVNTAERVTGRPLREEEAALTQAARAILAG